MIRAFGLGLLAASALSVPIVNAQTVSGNSTPPGIIARPAVSRAASTNLTACSTLGLDSHTVDALNCYNPTLSTTTSDSQFSTVSSVSSSGNPNSKESGGFLTEVITANTSANAWASASEVYLQSGSQHGTVYEADIVNTNCDPGIFNANSGSCAGAGTGFLADGIDTGAGSSYHPGLAAIWVLNSNGGIMWHHGLLASGNSVDGPLVADLTSSSEAGLYMGGTHSHVIDVSTANITGGMWYGPLTVNRPTSGFSLALQNPSGTCTHTPNAGSETVSCSSDVRLKSDFGAPSDALGRLMQYHLKSYKVRSTGTRVDIGVIAQEVQKLEPGKVHTGENGYLSVDMPTPWELTRAIQEQQQEIIDLKKIITSLTLNRKILHSPGIQTLYRKKSTSIHTYNSGT